jgi:DNA-binding NtrC family response regulator
MDMSRRVDATSRTDNASRVERADPSPSVLIVDDDLELARDLAEALSRSGATVRVTSGARLARALREGPYDVVLADRSAASPAELLDLLRAEDQPALIQLASFGSVHDAVLAMRDGAFDYIEKPASEDQIVLAVGRALERRSLEVENRRLNADLGQRFELGSLVSRDPRMQRVFETVAAVRDTRATILIEGESGTGKTMLARTIHGGSERRAGPFVEVNCGALPASLLESELFGHVRGAFTGAVRDKAGKFEAAHNGTLFLDEIATAPPELQIKLLRVLQDKVFERVGDTRTRTVDVRILAASNRPLDEEVRAGRFREDLYYRIKVLTLELSPLRERPGDVHLLAEAFVTRFAAEHNRAGLVLEPGCLPVLAAHRWPGNVRELEHAIERAVLLAPGPAIRPQDLGPEVRAGGAGLGAGRDTGLDTGADAEASGRAAVDLPAVPGPLKEALAGPEREIIRRALMIHRGNRNATARMLEINRTTLFNKMRKYGLLDTDFGRTGEPTHAPSPPQ